MSDTQKQPDPAPEGADVRSGDARDAEDLERAVAERQDGALTEAEVAEAGEAARVSRM
jgi:hypothetical protein